MVAWGAIAQLAGSLMNTAGSFGAGMLNFGQQKELQQRQFDWQERMSSTAHQREIRDLKTAGLNPILSVMGGQGASTPSGGMGTINTPDYGASMMNGITTAAQVKRTNAESRFINEQAKTEEKKRDNFEAQNALWRAERIGKEIDNLTLNERNKATLKNIISNSALNYATASANQINAMANKMNASTNRMVGKEQAKYTKERSRGYSKSATVSKSTGWNVHKIGGNQTSATQSKSETW